MLKGVDIVNSFGSAYQITLHEIIETDEKESTFRLEEVCFLFKMVLAFQKE